MSRAGAPPRRFGLLASAALVAALALGGCAVGPNFQRPAVPGPDRYLAGGDPKAAGDAVAADWWRAFGSDALDRLVEQGVRNSPTLVSAQAALRQSQAQLNAGAGVFLPSLDAGGSAAREHGSPAAEAVGLPRQTFSLFTLQASVNYALDVFGGERRQVEGLAAERDVQRDLYGAAYLSLTSNIANTAIAHAAYAEEVKAVERLIGYQRQELQVTRQLFAAGEDTYTAVLTVQSALAANQALIPALQQKQAAAEDLMATLEGAAPGAWSEPDLPLASLSLPAGLPLSLPSQLVRQRPDILAAEGSLHAASAQIGVATAAMLPAFSIGGTYGTDATTTATLFGPGAAFWSVGPSVTAPLFHGGTLYYNRKAAIAAYDKAKADYRSTALSAFAQVADTLRALQHDAAIVAAQQSAFDAASEAERLGRVNERSGLSSALDVLVLDAQLEQANLQLIEAVAQRYQDTVALYAALGGGWSETPKAAPGSRP